MTIPAGSILPVRLPSLSSDRVKQGDAVKAKIAQDVPLPGGAKLRAGTPILAHVVSVSGATANSGGTLTIKFDTLLWRGQAKPIRTNLRAMASMMEVEFAQIPESGPGESDVYDWLTTRQIGGDSVYGKQGPVENESGVVGRSTFDGVLVKLTANLQNGCRGALFGNDAPQALWVFSSDACGLYGYPYLKIRRSGRTAPVGEIVLESMIGPVHIQSGSGALLRIAGANQE